MTKKFKSLLESMFGKAKAAVDESTDAFLQQNEYDPENMAKETAKMIRDAAPPLVSQADTMNTTLPADFLDKKKRKPQK